MPAEQKIKWERHEVSAGETLAGLAKKYNTTPEAIRDINGLKKNSVTPGKHLLIPEDINAKPHDASLLIASGRAANSSRSSTASAGGKRSPR